MTTLDRASARAAGSFALLLLVLGCSPGQADRPDADNSSTSPKPEATGGTDPDAPVEAASIAIDSAKPLEPESDAVLGTVPLLAEGTSKRVVAVGPDGSTLVAQHRVGGGDAVVQDTLMLHPGAPDDSGTRIPSPHHPKPQQVLGATIADRWVVWMETTSNGVDVQPWVMYAYDRRARRSTELAHSRNIGENPPPPPPGFTAPSVTGDAVYWAQVGGSFGAETVDVMGCRIASCKPISYASGAAFPAATDDGLYVIATSRYAGDAKTPVSSMSIKKVDVRTKRATEVTAVTLQPDQQPGGLAASESDVIWAVGGHPSHVGVLHLDTQTRTTVEADNSGMFGYPVAGDSLVAWAESSGASPADVGGYLLNTESRTLNSIGNTAGLYTIHADGHFLSWQDARTPAARPEDITTTVARMR